MNQIDNAIAYLREQADCSIYADDKRYIGEYVAAIESLRAEIDRATRGRDEARADLSAFIEKQCQACIKNDDATRDAIARAERAERAEAEAARLRLSEETVETIRNELRSALRALHGLGADRTAAAYTSRVGLALADLARAYPEAP